MIDSEIIPRFMKVPETTQRLAMSRTGELTTKAVPFTIFHYHDSWDWLMPVIAKMNEALEAEGNQYVQHIATMLTELEHALGRVDIKTCHLIVVNIIKWINDHKA